MSLVNPSQASPGEEITAAKINNPVNTLAAAINGSLDSANLADSAATTPKIADGSVTKAKLNTTAGELGGAWQSWTPTWTNFTVAGSTVTARYIQVGKTVFFRIVVVLAGGNVPGTNPTFSLPVTSVSYAGTASNQPIGRGKCVDTGTASFPGSVYWNSTTTASMNVWNTAATYAFEANITSAIPHTWANTDELHVQGCYEAA